MGKLNRFIIGMAIGISSLACVLVFETSPVISLLIGAIAGYHCRMIDESRSSIPQGGVD